MENYTCHCGKKYKYEGAFNKHKSKCNAETQIISNSKTLPLEINKSQETQEIQETQETQETQSITKNQNVVIQIVEPQDPGSKLEPHEESNVYKNEICFMKWVLDFRFVNREFKKRAQRPIWMYNIRVVHEELLHKHKMILMQQQEPQKQKEEGKSKIIVKKDKKIIKNK